MKKFLACTVATIIAASMMTACGSDDSKDSSSKAAESTTTTAASSAAESATEESAAEESAADESATEESAADESAAEGDAAEPKPISEMPATLQDLETASLVFDTSMDPADFVKTMNEANFENDESDVAFSIEEVEGVPMLRCQVLTLKDEEDPSLGYKVPKIQFDMSKIFAGKTDTLDKVFTIDIEFMTRAVGNFVSPDDGTEMFAPGNFMGALCSQAGEDPDNLGWKELDNQISESEWTSEWATYKFSVRPGLLGPFSAVDTPQYLTFMRWSIPNQADFYVADITFKDEDGNILPVSIGAHAE